MIRCLSENSVQALNFMATRPLNLFVSCVCHGVLFNTIQILFTLINYSFFLRKSVSVPLDLRFYNMSDWDILERNAKLDILRITSPKIYFAFIFVFGVNFSIKFMYFFVEFHFLTTCFPLNDTNFRMMKMYCETIRWCIFVHRLQNHNNGKI